MQELLIQSDQEEQDEPEAMSPLNMLEFLPQDELSKEVISLAQYAIRKRVTSRAAGARQTTQALKQNIVQQFNSAFQLIGGVPRLAIWADKNPTAFFALYSKMLPAAIKLDSTTLDPNSLTADDLRDVSTDQLKLMVYREAARFEQVTDQGINRGS